MMMDRAGQQGFWRRLVALLSVCAVLVVSSMATASNYYLADLGRFGDPVVESFRKQGIETTEQFLAKALTDRARKALARQVKMKEAELLEFAKDCEFMQITGVGPKATRLLRASGVESVEDLASRKADELLATIKKTNAESKITETNPNLSVVEYWIEQAKKVPYHLKAN